MKNKRGLSPVIATVLLIAIVLVIALMVFLWFRSFAREAVVKFDQNVEIVCERVVFDADYSEIFGLEITNNGNIPIEDFQIKIYSSGGYDTEVLSEDYEGYDAIGETRVRQGKTETFDINVGEASKIIIIPILRGTSDSGEKNVPCEERYGKEIIL